MRVVTDANGVRRVEVECRGCGHAWQSASRSGRTTCPECGERVYIPAELRREAFAAEPAVTQSSTNGYDTEDEYDPDAGHDLGGPLPFGDDGSSLRKDPQPRFTPPPSPRPARRVSPKLSDFAKILADASLRRSIKSRQHRQPMAATAQRPAPIPTVDAVHEQRARRANIERTERRAEPRTTPAILACGHEVSLSGDPYAWRGVAARCEVCSQHANVAGLPEIGWRA